MKIWCKYHIDRINGIFMKTPLTFTAKCAIIMSSFVGDWDALEFPIRRRETMKRVLTIVASITIAMSAFAEPSDKLINALVRVESGGRASVVGDNGRAVGVLQIHKCVIDDVNKFSKTKYTYADRANPTKSREICKKYLLRYAGANATNEHYARVWNGGPKGHTKKATVKYWNKVKKAMANA